MRRESVGGQQQDARLAKLEVIVEQQARELAQLRRALRIVGVALSEDSLRSSADASTAES